MSPDFSALEITDTNEGCVFAVKVVPGSSRNRIVGTLGEALKVAIAAAPEKGAANKALQKLLARHLHTKPAQVQILAGHTQPRKKILIKGLASRDLRSSL